MNDVFKALADPTRRQVLQALKAGPQSAGRLASAFPVSKPTMSAHFAVLRQAGLVHSERCGSHVHYSLNRDKVAKSRKLFMETLGRHLLEDD